jgi:hypothetical protein
VGPDADRALILIDDLYLEQELATVAHFPKSGARDTPGALRSSAHMFDANLKPDGRLALWQVGVDEHRRRPLHHRDHSWRRQDRKAKRPANIRQQQVVDLERLCGFDP